jgi:DNA polymerase-3 subunit epsilon
MAILDLETTGPDTSKDRIIEISILVIEPDHQTFHTTRRVNPEMPISPGATEVHGIVDEDLVGEPTFDLIAFEVVGLLSPCDLCGFNIRRFDIPLLRNELRRCGHALDLAGRAIVDPMRIYHDRERRDLTAAVRFFCGREHDGAHGAQSDVLATAEILGAMLTRYEDLPRNPVELHSHCCDAGSIDFDGKFARKDGLIVFTFGKYKGESIQDVVRKDAGYCDWMLRQDFEQDTLDVIRALRR